MAFRTLRTMLESLGVERAQEYRTHDLRRGHAEDLRVSGTASSLVLFFVIKVFLVEGHPYG
eukprot:11101711-Karenia_brevis.AAC.1